MLQSRRYGFSEGWMVAVVAMGVPEDSPFRNLEQIPYPDPSPPPVHNSARAEEEDSPSMRALVEEIDSHVELVDLEIINDPNAKQGQMQPPLLDPNLLSAMEASFIMTKQPLNPST